MEGERTESEFIDDGTLERLSLKWSARCRVREEWEATQVPPTLESDSRDPKLRLAMITWNHNGQDVSRAVKTLLEPLLDCDLICVASVECGSSSGVLFPRPTIEWEQTVQEYIRPSHDLLAVSSLNAISLLVARRRGNAFCDLEIVAGKALHIRTGVANIVGNKGAVLIPIFAGNATFVVGSLHLCAHEGCAKKRAADLQHISNKLNETFEWDVIIMAGDFNFRLEMPVVDVLRSIHLGDLDSLLEHDEFRRGVTSLRSGLNEWFEIGSIRFRPTYKLRYRDGSMLYKDQRVPSYTDRILLRSKIPWRFKTVIYGSHEVPLGSDHKPVFGIMNISVF